MKRPPAKSAIKPLKGVKLSTTGRVMLIKKPTRAPKRPAMKAMIENTSRIRPRANAMTAERPTMAKAAKSNQVKPKSIAHSHAARFWARPTALD